MVSIFRGLITEGRCHQIFAGLSCNPSASDHETITHCTSRPWVPTLKKPKCKTLKTHIQVGAGLQHLNPRGCTQLVVMIVLGESSCINMTKSPGCTPGLEKAWCQSNRAEDARHARKTEPHPSEMRGCSGEFGEERATGMMVAGSGE